MMRFMGTVNSLAAVLVVFSWALVCGSATMCNAQVPTGGIKCRFAWDGEHPRPSRFTVPNIADTIEDESLMINPDNGGVRNVFLYVIRSNKHDRANRLDDSKLGPPTIDLTLSNAGFNPRAIVLLTSQELDLKNGRDGTTIIARTRSAENVDLGRLLRGGDRSRFRFKVEEPLPVELRAQDMPWARCFVLVRNSSDFCISDRNGECVITGIPAGECALQVWHERSGLIQEIMRTGIDSRLVDGVLTANVSEGEITDMGVVNIWPGEQRLK